MSAREDRRAAVLQLLSRRKMTCEEMAQAIGSSPTLLREVRHAVAACCGAGDITQTGERDHSRLHRLTDQGRERLAKGGE